MSSMADRLEAEIPGLRRYAWALTRDDAAADDLVQDCLERAMSRWYLRRPDGNLRAWLFTILRNLHISGLRQRRRRGPHEDIDAACLPGVSGGQEEALACSDIFDALDRLPEEQKSLILLVGVEDMSYGDAAEILAIPVGTVMSRLSRGRAALRRLLDRRPAAPLRRVK